MRKVAFPLSAPPILLAGLCLCLYLVTLAPGQLGGDAGELQLVPATLSLAHPTGYPLHSLLGKVWVSMLPVGSVAWRMNLLAACAAALCVGLLCDTLHQLTQSGLHVAVPKVAANCLCRTKNV